MPDFGGYYAGADLDDTADDMDFPATNSPGAMGVLVNSVRLDAGDKVTFVYSGTAQPTAGDATFGVDLDGGAGPGTGLVAVPPLPKAVR